jgi:copper chaperone NosL
MSPHSFGDPRGRRRAGALLMAALVLACVQGPPPPALLDTRNEWCGFCRMAISDARFASQLVAPAEEPTFFDDLGCLANYLRSAKSARGGARVYVADHRTKAWVRAADAVYTKVPGIETPMGSHVMAHADPASRDADPEARAGEPVTPAGLYGSPLPAPVAGEPRP